MDMEKISSVVTSICAAVVLLTPLVKALSTWHIALRKMSKPDTKAMTRKAQTSNASIQPLPEPRWYRQIGFLGWVSLVGLVCVSLVAIMCLRMLFDLAQSEAPLTTGTAAKIVVAAVFLIVGLMKEWRS
jgi:hypothetical protein